jgi:hypothetical protein
VNSIFTIVDLRYTERSFAIADEDVAMYFWDMKHLTTTTTGNFFDLEGVLSHAGDYAGKYVHEAYVIMESVSRDITRIAEEGTDWADIMFNERTGKVFAVWASGELTMQNALLQYVELDKEDCSADLKAEVFGGMY